jgi:hypothetical protein
MRKAKKTSFSLTDTARIILLALSSKRGINRTAVLETLLREAAAHELTQADIAWATEQEMGNAATAGSSDTVLEQGG